MPRSAQGRDPKKGKSRSRFGNTAIGGRNSIEKVSGRRRKEDIKMIGKRVCDEPVSYTTPTPNHARSHIRTLSWLSSLTPTRNDELQIELDKVITERNSEREKSKKVYEAYRLADSSYTSSGNGSAKMVSRRSRMAFEEDYKGESNAMSPREVNPAPPVLVREFCFVLFCFLCFFFFFSTHRSRSKTRTFPCLVILANFKFRLVWSMFSFSFGGTRQAARM